ncbi:uncharacterized protein LOC144021807 isoform X2 [Festucalex cinctus]
MRLVICLLVLLPLVTAVPIRAHRENVLSFLSDALSTTTGKTRDAMMTAHRNPPNEPKKEQDSQDLSESFESANQDTIAVSGANYGGESKDLDSDETPGRQMGAPLVSRRADQDQQSADGNSEEDVADGVNVPSVVSTPGSVRKMKASAEGDTSKEAADQDSLETESDELKQTFGPGLRAVGASPG